MLKLNTMLFICGAYPLELPLRKVCWVFLSDWNSSIFVIDNGVVVYLWWIQHWTIIVTIALVQKSLVFLLSLRWKEVGWICVWCASPFVFDVFFFRMTKHWRVVWKCRHTILWRQLTTNDFINMGIIWHVSMKLHMTIWLEPSCKSPIISLG